MTERDIETLRIFAGFLHMAQRGLKGGGISSFVRFFFNRRSSATQRNVNMMRQLGGLPSFCTVPAGADALQSKKFLLSVYPCKTWKRRVQRYSSCPKKRHWGGFKTRLYAVFQLCRSIKSSNWWHSLFAFCTKTDYAVFARIERFGW